MAQSGLFDDAAPAARAPSPRLVYRDLVEFAPDPLFVHDLHGLLLVVNDAFVRVAGRPRDELLGRPVWDLLADDVADAVRDAIDRIVCGGAPGVFELELDAASGPVLLEVTARPLYSNGRAVAVQGIGRDITARAAQAAAFRHKALHDALTGLPNRAHLADRLEQALHAAHRTGSAFAVLMLDLNGFKNVNDEFGHQGGDVVLEEVARRLRAAARESDLVARLGGDEFVILLHGAGTRQALLASKRIAAAFRRPFDVHGSTVRVGAAMGLAVFPQDGEDGAALFRFADDAMYSSKRGLESPAAGEAGRPAPPRRRAVAAAICGVALLA